MSSDVDEEPVEYLTEEVAEVAATIFLGEQYPDPGSGWTFGESPLIALPSNRIEGLWFACRTNGDAVDALYPDRFGSYRQLAEHLARIDELEVAGQGSALDFEESADPERGVQ